MVNKAFTWKGGVAWGFFDAAEGVMYCTVLETCAF